MSLPNLLKEICDKYLDGRKDAFWQHKQSGQWLIKHRDLEIAAGRAGIRFDAPQVLESDASKCVAIVVTGRLSDAVEWSIGEASPKNTQQAYPYAMAEKRAKDRVILKLFGVHGHAYSEEEADDFKTPPAPIDQKESAAVDWALGYVEGRAAWADKVGLDGENSAMIAAACKYPRARAILEKAEVPL